MTFSVPEENTLGVVITGKGRKRVKQPRRSGRVANSAHRATLGVAYLGLGAYSVGILATRHSAPFWVTLLVGVLLATVVASIFGLLALRASGVYFLMITLALGMVVWGLAHRWVTMTQGDNGISGVPRPSLGLPWSFSHGIPFYYLALAGFLLALLVLRTIVRSPFVRLVRT